MKYGYGLAVILGLLAVGVGGTPARSAGYPAAQFDLVGVVFDDGGQLTGAFDFNMSSAAMPLPQFYNVQISTSSGSVLPGSNFSSVRVCFDRTKKFVCAPGDDFVMSLETGVLGEPGYDRLQLATFFAPNASFGPRGLLDPAASYEIGCTQTGCFTRHITAGAIRWGTLL